MEGTPRHRGGPPANPFTPQDVEAGAASTPSAIPAPVKPAPKPAAKATHPLVPRAIAALAILVLLAIPVAVPLAVMRATGKTGQRLTPLEAAIEGPPDIQVVTPPEETTPEEQKESFLRISNTTFERFCRPYYSSGFNAYELVETAMVSKRAETVGGRAGATIVEDTLREAAEKGMNTVRMWAHTTSDVFPFQTSPGVYDERGIRSLDYVLEMARKYGLQVILSFVDNWKYYNGVDQYMDWAVPRPAGEESPTKNLRGDYTDDLFAGPQGADLKRRETVRHAQFFNHPEARKMYKNHITYLTNRVNSINGRKYKDDPTIVAWNLINEPRCENWVDANRDCPARLQSWIDEMAQHLRNQDGNHLITVGSEGFFGPSTPDLWRFNPADWANGTGQDFTRNLNSTNVDFGTVHAWPDNWFIKPSQTAVFLRNWINSHITAGKQLGVGKPIMFEEFGKKLTEDQQGYANMILNLRDPIYQSVYDYTQTAINNGDGIAGSLFWKLSIPVFQGQNWRGEYGVMFDDSTMNIVTKNADFVKRRMNSQPPRPECNIGAWFPVDNGSTRTCVNNPDASDAYYSATPSNNATVADLVTKLKAGQLLVFPTKAACCKPGTGFWEGGCT